MISVLFYVSIATTVDDFVSATGFMSKTKCQLHKQFLSFAYLASAKLMKTFRSLLNPFALPQARAHPVAVGLNNNRGCAKGFGKRRNEFAIIGFL